MIWPFLQFAMAKLSATVAIVLMLAMAAWASECDDELNNLVNDCSFLILGGTKPSAKCCLAVKAARPNCVCPKVDSSVANLITGKRAAALASSCGRILPHNFQYSSTFLEPIECLKVSTGFRFCAFCVWRNLLFGPPAAYTLDTDDDNAFESPALSSESAVHHFAPFSRFEESLSSSRSVGFGTSNRPWEESRLSLNGQTR